jgi:CRP-like cAMP-binding protein
MRTTSCPPGTTGFIPDEEGRYFPGPREAREAAVEGACSLLRAEVTEGMLDVRVRIEVTDAQQRPILAVDFRDTLQGTDGPCPDERWGRSQLPNVGETLARHAACFGRLPETDRAALAALNCEVHDLPRLKDAVREGDHPTHVVVVLSGLLYRYNIGPDGGRQIHSFYLPTEAPCLETLYIDYMDNNLGAAANSRIGLISHDQLYRLIDERPEVRKLLWRQTLVQGAIFRMWLVRNSNLPAHASLAHFFCEMFTRAGAAGLVSGNRFDLPLTQEFVADALGLTAVHTNRTMQVLRSTGAIEWRGGTVAVLDWGKLAEMADFDARYLHLRCG